MDERRRLAASCALSAREAQRGGVHLLSHRSQGLHEATALERAERVRPDPIARLLAAVEAADLLLQAEAGEEAEALGQDLCARPAQVTGVGCGLDALER